MLTLPAKQRRKKQAFLSMRSQLVRRNLARQATLFFAELRDFIAGRAIEDAGPGFMRYLSVRSDGELDIEFGYLTTRLYPGGGPVRSGMLPSGTFVRAEWTGPYERLGEIHAMLPGWAEYAGIDLDVTATEDSTQFGCRLNIFHVTPRFTNDPAEFRTEVAILTRPASDAGRI